MQAQEAAGRPRLLQAAIDAFRIPDLRARILFTLALLIVYRFIAHVPIPGVDADALTNVFKNNQLLGFLDLFSGGAMRRLSIAAMGVYPYITSTIVFQLLTPVIPPLQRMSKEGETGRQKLNRLMHWFTVPIAIAQGYSQLLLLQQAGVLTNVGLTGSALAPTVAAVLSITAGTMFLVWLGELISERGIGNGISLIIFAGIVANFPTLMNQGFMEGGNTGGLFAFGIIVLGIIYLIVYFTEAQRRIPVQYGRSIFRGGRMYRQTGGSYIPLRVNSAGMIPLIFAFSIVLLPGQIGSYLAYSGGWVGSVATFFARHFSPSAPTYWVLTFVLVVAFTFFYTMVMFGQQNLAENLQRNSGFIPGIRPGKPTQDYLNRIILRITWGGAFFLGVVAILPYIASSITGVQAVQLSGASLLIMVGVALDTLRQLEAQLLMRRYEGFLR
jgi:preprotein translocase subunit SecY